MNTKQAYVSLQSSPNLSPKQSRKERTIEIKRAAHEAAVEFSDWLHAQDINATIDPPIDKTSDGFKITAQEVIIDRLLQGIERPAMVASVEEVDRWEAK